MAENKKIGRPKIEGTKRLYVVPQDCLDIISRRGIPWMWEAVRTQNVIENLKEQKQVTNN